MKATINNGNFPSNRGTILKKLARSGLVHLYANDCVRCAAGQVWITAAGGSDLLLAEGQWVRIPANARAVWLTALSEAMVAIAGPGRVAGQPLAGAPAIGLGQKVLLASKKA